MTIGVFYVNVNNLHDRSFNTFLKIDIKKCRYNINTNMGKVKKTSTKEIISDKFFMKF
jgi:hypothetical protein